MNVRVCESAVVRGSVARAHTAVRTLAFAARAEPMGDDRYDVLLRGGVPCGGTARVTYVVLPATSRTRVAMAGHSPGVRTLETYEFVELRAGAARVADEFGVNYTCVLSLSGWRQCFAPLFARRARTLALRALQAEYF